MVGSNRSHLKNQVMVQYHNVTMATDVSFLYKLHLIWEKNICNRKVNFPKKIFPENILSNKNSRNTFLHEGESPLDPQIWGSLIFQLVVNIWTFCENFTQIACCKDKLNASELQLLVIKTMTELTRKKKDERGKKQEWKARVRWAEKIEGMKEISLAHFP